MLKILFPCTGGGPQFNKISMYEFVLDAIPDDVLDGITPFGVTESIPRIVSISEFAKQYHCHMASCDKNKSLNFDTVETCTSPPEKKGIRRVCFHNYAHCMQIVLRVLKT